MSTSHQPCWINSSHTSLWAAISFPASHRWSRAFPTAICYWCTSAAWAGQCRYSRVLSADRCHLMSYLALCFTHLQTHISPESPFICKSRQSDSDPLLSCAAFTIKPNYTILLFLSNHMDGCWGWVRFNVIIETLLFTAPRDKSEMRRDGRCLSKCLLMEHKNPICSHKATSLQLC